MKIFLICSKVCYKHVPNILETLKHSGHTLVLPNAYDDPGTEDQYKQLSAEEHATWKAGMLRQSAKKMEDVDAVLVINFEKNGIPNYIGGATFLEMYDAFRLGKKVFLYNPIPDGILADEIRGFNPVIINGDLTKVIER
jgi:hypothetical protein